MFAALLLAAAAATEPTLEGVTYAVVGGRALELDLYKPAGSGVQRPCVVWIHGGAWAGGARYPLPPRAQALVDAGIAVASIDYRLTSQAGLFGNEPVTFPAQIHDAKGAVRWLRAHAGVLGLDPLRFGAYGASSGGHLAALLATSFAVPALEGDVGGNQQFGSNVQAAAAFATPTDLLRTSLDVTHPPGSVVDHDAPSSPQSLLLGFDGPGEGIGVLRANLTNPLAPYPALAALAAAANPITWVNVGDAPMFLAHGDRDEFVPWKQSQRLADALHAAHVPVRFHLQAGGEHGSHEFDLGPVEAAIVGFFVQAFQGALDPTPLCASGAPSFECPCGNLGFAGHGCANSQAWGAGALLDATGGAAADTLVLRALGAPPNATCVFLQGSATAATPVFVGDGVRCAGGTVVRLATRAAFEGAASYPAAGEPSIRARSAALGAPIPPGGSRVYQVFYRDPIEDFCGAPAGGNSNLTNALRVVWP